MKLKWKQWLPYILSVGIALGIGFLSSLLSANGREAYETMAVKPMLTPPGWLFFIVWTALYALMGISAVRIWQKPSGSERGKALNLYVLQLILNFFWSLIFFNARAYGFAAIWLLILWGVVFMMIRSFDKLDKPAAYLQLPYLFWLTFAAYLNIATWVLNS